MASGIGSSINRVLVHIEFTAQEKYEKNQRRENLTGNRRRTIKDNIQYLMIGRRLLLNIEIAVVVSSVVVAGMYCSCAATWISTVCRWFSACYWESGMSLEMVVEFA